jgi:hypothetical protein
VIGGQSLAERSDFGPRECRHAATLGQVTDADIPCTAITAGQRLAIPSCAAIHNRYARPVDLPLNRR